MDLTLGCLGSYALSYELLSSMILGKTLNPLNFALFTCEVGVKRPTSSGRLFLDLKVKCSTGSALTNDSNHDV